MKINLINIILLLCTVLISCSNKDFPTDTTKKAPASLHVAVTIAGASATNPGGDGSGIVTFTLSASNATYYQLVLPTQNAILKLDSAAGGKIQYSFGSHPATLFSYPVQVSAYNQYGHADTTFFVSVYFAVPKSQVAFWKTYPAGGVLFSKQNTALNFQQVSNSYPTIVVDSTQTFQTMDGFGFALTGGSASLLNGLSGANKTSILKELFSTDSTFIGTSYLRISIGASDLSSHPFSYDEVAGDSTLQYFSIDMEKTDLIPILQQILQINPC